MNLVCNGTATFPSTYPGAAAPDRSSGARGPALRIESSWLPDFEPSCGQRGDDNAWRAVNTRRAFLSREAIVACIRQQVDPSLLPAPEQPDAAAVAASAVNLGQAMLDGMRSLFASMPTLRIGPAGAEAAPTADRPAADRVSYFIKRFEKKFDIRKSPALAGHADLSGVTVVIGGKGDTLGSAAMQVLGHLRRENGDRLMMEGRSQNFRWNHPTCERFDAELHANCLPIEAGCTASDHYYAALNNYEVAVHTMGSFTSAALSTDWPDVKFKLPGNIDECVEFNARYADMVAMTRPEGIAHHTMQIKSALDHLNDTERRTREARQACMLERIRQPIETGAARFALIHIDFLAGLAPRLLAEGKVILMMPADIAAGDARYRMPYAGAFTEQEEL